jgi:hypothetical protein
MPYICMRRTDIPNGTLQVLDLDPNESQRSLIYDPPGQTKYVNRVANETVAALVGGTTTGVVHAGLAAYLIDNVIDDVSSVTITVTVANDAAAGLIAILDAGTALTEALVNADIIATGGAGAGTDINANGSTGALVDILRILAGGEYVLPAGSLVGGLAAAAALGSFTVGQFRHTYVAGALTISIGAGELSTFTDPTFSYEGTVGAAVAVYADAGTLLS